MKYVDCSAPVREYLCQADPVLGAHIRRIGELYRPMKEDLFTALCSSIVSQLISKKAAATVFGRLVERCGGAISPQALADLIPQEIQQCGMSMRKAENLSRIAHSVLSGETDLEHLQSLSDPEIVRVLSALPGVGEWTAQMLMIFAMGRPDVISYKDLGIRRGMMAAYGLESLNKKQFDAIARAYHPHASAASIYLWHLSDEVTGSTGLAQIN